MYIRGDDYGPPPGEEVVAVQTVGAAQDRGGDPVAQGKGCHGIVVVVEEVEGVSVGGGGILGIDAIAIGFAFVVVDVVVAIVVSAYRYGCLFVLGWGSALLPGAVWRGGVFGGEERGVGRRGDGRVRGRFLESLGED